jgi:hypothetical protein
MKFEEDITTPFTSRFSLSASYKIDQNPGFNKFKDLVSVFPRLDLGISADEELTKVNNFVAIEERCKAKII